MESKNGKQILRDSEPGALTPEILNREFDKTLDELGIPSQDPSPEEVDESIELILQTLEEDHPPKEIKAIKEALTKLNNQRMEPYSAMGLTQDNLEVLYAEAYGSYNSGKFEKAISMFHTLVFLAPNEVKFWYGLAGSYQSMKDYVTASIIYTKCVNFEPENPIIYWYIADCYKKMGNLLISLTYLRICAEKANGQPALEKIKMRAEAEIDIQQKEFNRAIIDQISAAEEELSKNEKEKTDESKP